MDTLSDVLSLVKPRTYVTGRLTAGGRWAVDFPAHAGIKFYAVVQGECCVVVHGVRAPVRLVNGDCLMLPHGRPFKLCSDPTTRAVDARELFVGAPSHTGTRALAPGHDLLLFGGHFALEGNADLLLGVLPPVVHLREASDKASLRSAVERMMEEMRTPQPGGYLIAQQSAYTMLVLALRRFLAGTEGGVGWLHALADPQLAAALAAIHEQPSHGWTVQTLAESVGMSRTAFAERFRKTVGASPMEYLTRWRMLVAADRLLHSNDTISMLAQSTGYESESAFSAAFKRTMGASPREYARDKKPALPTHA